MVSGIEPSDLAKEREGIIALQNLELNQDHSVSIDFVQCFTLSEIIFLSNYAYSIFYEQV